MCPGKGDAPEEELRFGKSPAFPFAVLYDVNERCVELLTQAARHESRLPAPLVAQLRPVLRNTTPQIRHSMAQCGFLLVDLGFQESEWWRSAQTLPERRWRTVGFHEAFPRRTAVPLARATLMLAWYGIQADPRTARALFGMTRPVAQAIGRLPLSELDRIADRRYRHLMPRWHDRPSLWLDLFSAAQSANAAATRVAHLHALQLLAGSLLRAAALDIDRGP